MAHEKQEWGSRLGVILAVAGSAVGLGNFLRFPGQAAANGGGAFMIPYFCALLFLGIPIGWAEWTMGRYGGRKGFHSAPAILGVLGRGAWARYLGVIGVLIPLAVYFYYVIIESWCLQYCFEYLRGGMGIDPTTPVADQNAMATAFYDRTRGASGDGVLFSENTGPLLFWGITFAINLYFVFRGLSKGIEAFCKWAMPAMAVCALIVLIRVMTLGTPDESVPDQNVINGLGKMWNPDYSKLMNAGTWMAAAGQIFFSLSVGFGVIINYASYLKRKDDVVLSGLTASATNELFEVGFGGMITITAAFVFLGASGTVGGTFGMGFRTLPVVFAHMPLGNLIGAIWFFMLFLAAITSSLSMLQPAKAFIEEATGLGRGASTTLITVASLAGSLFVLWFSGAPLDDNGLRQGGVALTTIDDWVGTFFIVLLAAVQVICFAYVFGIKRGFAEAHQGAQMRIPGLFKFVLLVVTPGYLAVMIFMFCKDTLPGWIWGDPAQPWVNSISGNAVTQMSIGLIALVTLALVVLTAMGAKRWRAQKLDLDGEHIDEAMTAKGRPQ